MKGKAFNWEVMDKKMDKDEKRLLNYLQDVLIKKDHFARLREEVEDPEKFNQKVRNDGALLIR